MEEKNTVEIKRDELGIISMDAREQITIDIRNIIINTDLSDVQNKKRFDELLKNNKELMDSLAETAFYILVRKVANECGEFNTSEYLIDKYKLDSNSIDIDGDFYSIARETVEKYLEQDKLISKYENYINSLSEEVDTLSEKEDDIEDENELEKYEVRISGLIESISEIDEFISDPTDYSDRALDNYTYKLMNYILNNADLYVNTSELFKKLINSIQDVSPESKRIYLTAIMEYAKKYEATNKRNGADVISEESLETGKRVK